MVKCWYGPDKSNANRNGAPFTRWEPISGSRSRCVYLCKHDPWTTGGLPSQPGNMFNFLNEISLGNFCFFFCIFRKKYFRHLWSLLTCSFRFCCFIPTTGRNSGRNESVSIRPTAWIRTSFHASGPRIEGKPDEIWEAVHDHIQYLSSGPWFMAFLLKFPRIWSEFGHWKN